MRGFWRGWLFTASCLFALSSALGAGTTDSVEADGIHFKVYKVGKQYRGEELSLAEQDLRGLKAVDAHGARLSGVQYLSAEERARYRIDLNDRGLFVQLGDPSTQRLLPPERWMPLSSAMQTFAGLIVMDTQFNIYFSQYSGPTFIHASLLAGGNVLFAGTAIFHEGKLEVLAHNSGHYKTDYYSMLNFVRRIKKLGYSGDKILLRGTKNRSIDTIAERYKWFDPKSIERIRGEFANGYVSVESLMHPQPCESAANTPP